MERRKRRSTSHEMCVYRSDEHRRRSQSSLASSSSSCSIMSSEKLELADTGTRKRLMKSHSLQPQPTANSNRSSQLYHLLHQKQELLLALEHEKAEQQEQLDTLAKQLKQKIQTEEKLKEDIWNLELARQDLLQQVEELTQRSILEQNRLQHQLKAAQANWHQVLEQQRHDHEREMASLQKTVDALRRRQEKQKAIIVQKNEQPVAQCSESVMPRQPSQAEKDGQRRLELEIETLQSSLRHAHEAVRDLESKLERERAERSEVDKLLREAQETIEGFHKEEELLLSKEEQLLPFVDTGRSLGEELVRASNSSTVISSLSSGSWICENLPSITNHNDALLDTQQEQKEGRYGSVLVQPAGRIYDPSPVISSARATAFHFDPDFAQNASQATLPSEQPPASLVPAVTRTMMGDWMYKYTRNVVGGGISEKKHRRFFWVHPYTRTLYWSSSKPGMGSIHPKSCLIVSFKVLSEDGASLLIETSTRNIKVQCLDDMAHRAWVKSLHYLVSMAEEKKDKSTWIKSASQSLLPSMLRSKSGSSKTSPSSRSSLQKNLIGKRSTSMSSSNNRHSMLLSSLSRLLSTHRQVFESPLNDKVEQPLA